MAFFVLNTVEPFDDRLRIFPLVDSDVSSYLFIYIIEYDLANLAKLTFGRINQADSSAEHSFNLSAPIYENVLLRSNYPTTVRPTILVLCKIHGSRALN